MRYVQAPEPVQLVNPKTKKPLQQAAPDGKSVEDMPPTTIASFNDDYILNNTRIGKGLAATKRVLRLEKLFAGAKPGDVVAVEDADWEAAKSILTDFEFANPKVGAQLHPFFSAWLDAKDEEPETN